MINYEERIQIALELEHWMHGSVNWPNNAQEPDYVARLVMDLPSALTSIFKKILPNQSIICGSAFIHQKPIVEFVKKHKYHNPELGDLLIVCRDSCRFGHVYNALLLQAKCTDNPLHTTIPQDHQYVLYSEWPEFKYHRAGVLNGKRRSVTPKTMTQGAQYLLIDKKRPCDMFTATVNDVLEASSCLPFSIASVLSFDEGRTFEVKWPREMWSQMIIDLLSLAGTSTFTRKKAIGSKLPRFYWSSFFDCIVKSSMDTQILENNDCANGMGVICIDLGDSLDR